MTTKQSDSNWQVARPLRAFWRGFAVLSLLVCIATPFISEVPSRGMFLLLGLAYCATLSFFALGICLLPARLRSRVLTGLFACAAFAFISMLAILFVARSGHLRALDFLFPASLWALGISGAVLLAFAFYGWFYRVSHDRTKVA